MQIKIEKNDISDDTHYSHYITEHPYSTVYHLPAWLKIIRETYKLSFFQVSAFKGHTLTGIISLVLIRDLFLRKALVSIPFFDSGGLLVNDDKSGKALLKKSLQLSKKLGASYLELRHTDVLQKSISDNNFSFHKSNVDVRSNKVGMLKTLPSNADDLMASFKSKLRSQIKRPIKAGLYSKIGAFDLLDDFYGVFSIHMRDLGSPIHSKSLMRNVLTEFKGKAKICIVYKDRDPIACSFFIGFKDTLSNPWASSLRDYNRFSPNMLLYWTMLKYACDNGYLFFDFGRSSLNEGTYRFKQQWGPQKIPLHWNYFYNKDGSKMTEISADNSTFDAAVQCWKKIPISITKIIGPPIRKRIEL